MFIYCKLAEFKLTMIFVMPTMGAGTADDMRNSAYWVCCHDLPYGGAWLHHCSTYKQTHAYSL